MTTKPDAQPSGEQRKAAEAFMVKYDRDFYRATDRRPLVALIAQLLADRERQVRLQTMRDICEVADTRVGFRQWIRDQIAALERIAALEQPSTRKERG